MLYTDDPEDVRWLKDVHLTNISLTLEPKSFVLWGNEDYPHRIELFGSQYPNIGDPCMVLIRSEETNLLEHKPDAEVQCYK